MDYHQSKHLRDLASSYLRKRHTDNGCQQTFLGIFHCSPVQAFWLDIPGSYCAINDKQFFFGSILAHVCLDIAILALPIIQVRKLHLPKLQRIGIIAMFMFGIL